MSDDLFEVKGGEALRDLGQSLKRAGDGKELRKQLLRELRMAGKPVTAAVRSNLAEKMPQAGGLAARLAKAKVATRNKLSGDSAGVSIQTSVPGYDLPAIEKGNARHPTFGHAPWVTQKVPANTVTEAVESKTDTMRDAVLDAMNKTADQIAKDAQ